MHFKFYLSTYLPFQFFPGKVRKRKRERRKTGTHLAFEVPHLREAPLKTTQGDRGFVSRRVEGGDFELPRPQIQEKKKTWLNVNLGEQGKGMARMYIRSQHLQLRGADVRRRTQTYKP
jgi:hypothetical protein